MIGSAARAICATDAFGHMLASVLNSSSVLSRQARLGLCSNEKPAGVTAGRSY